MSVHMCTQCPQRPEQGTHSPELALQTVMRHHGAGNQSWFPSQGISTLNGRAIALAHEL